MTHPTTPTTEQTIEAISLEWEKQTGYDSIPTIRRIYEQTSTGAYVCVFPRCRFARRDAVQLWRHVHTAHGPNSLPPSDMVPVEGVQQQQEEEARER